MLLSSQTISRGLRLQKYKKKYNDDFFILFCCCEYIQSIENKLFVVYHINLLIGVKEACWHIRNLIIDSSK